MYFIDQRLGRQTVVFRFLMMHCFGGCAVHDFVCVTVNTADERGIYPCMEPYWKKPQFMDMLVRIVAGHQTHPVFTLPTSVFSFNHSPLWAPITDLIVSSSFSPFSTWCQSLLEEFTAVGKKDLKKNPGVSPHDADAFWFGGVPWRQLVFCGEGRGRGQKAGEEE